MTPLEQHQLEIQKNLAAWNAKPLLRAIYTSFYQRIIALIDPAIPGRIVEIGSGIGNLKSHVPQAVTTDLFPNPWLDVVCDGYELPFTNGSVSHLVLFDVFHHLRAPNAFLREARRVLAPAGRVILFEPYISWLGYVVYGGFHHEPVALKDTISSANEYPRPRDYYAAQGNATRLFFRRELAGWPAGWRIVAARAFSSIAYVLSGGYSKPALYPAACPGALARADAFLSRWPRIFAARCLVALSPVVNR